MSRWLELNSGTAQLAAGEFSERVIENLIGRYLVAGQIGIDCGAADGRMVNAMLSAQSCGGGVLAFEPIPHIFNSLYTRLASPRLWLRQACVSDVVGTAEFFHVRDRRWISSLSRDRTSGYDVETLVVEVTTIDDEVESIKSQVNLPVGFIKLDIEGAEFRALLGAKNTLALDRPFVVFENSLMSAAQSFNYTPDEFFSFFGNLGYEIFDVFGTPLMPDCWHGPKRSSICWNFVAAHQDDLRLANFKKKIEGLLGEITRKI